MIAPSPKQPPRREGARADFARGVGSGLSVSVAILPFGLLFGALAVKNGFSIGEAVLMSTIVYGGASQMVSIELFGQKIAPWLIVFSIFAVNFRHVLYSAAIGRRTAGWGRWTRAFAFFFLTDPQFAETEARAERGLPITFAWYMGAALPVYLSWICEAAVGGYVGNMLPAGGALGIDFLLPIYFLGLVMGFRKRPLWLPVVLASGIASVVAINTVGSPWHVSIGALAGIAVAVVFTPLAEKEKHP